MVAFSDLPLGPDLKKGIAELGFTQCTPVQDKTFKNTLDGQDVIVQSQTGTGKTAAFLITIFHLMATDARFKGKQALILAPTRELAVQIETDAKAIGKYLPFKTVCLIGGMEYARQERGLKDVADILVGTPGRILDFCSSGKLNLKGIGIVVIDEADRMFDIGFLPDLRKIMRGLPSREERLTILFSATLSTKVEHLAWEHMNEPTRIEISPEKRTVDAIAQSIYHVANNEKFPLLLGLLRDIKPQTAIIFVNTKHETQDVALRLEKNGYKTRFLIGDLAQKQRLKIIDDLRNGEIQILVATDVAARGLHVEDLDLVVNYDLPADPENYVHRIGRTARAGKSGRAISLACERFVFNLASIESYIGITIPEVAVKDDLLSKDMAAGQQLVQRKPRFDDRSGKGSRPYDKNRKLRSDSKRPPRSHHQRHPGQSSDRESRPSHPRSNTRNAEHSKRPRNNNRVPRQHTSKATPAVQAKTASRTPTSLQKSFFAKIINFFKPEPPARK